MIDSSVLTEIVHSLDQGYVLVDAKARVTALGPRAAVLLGVLEVGDALGRACADLLPTPGYDGAIFSGPGSALEKCLKRGEDWGGPINGIVVDTPTGTRHLNIQLRRLSAGGAVVLIADAAPIREVLDAQDALVSVTSHELKTPLTAIKAMSELMLSYEIDEAERKDMIGDIYKQAERLEALIKDILDASHLDSGRMEVEVHPVALRQALSEVLDELEGPLQGRKLMVKVPARLPSVAADRAKLRQVLVNLMTNALKYSPDASPVSIKAAVEDSKVRVAVTDRGSGIKPEDLGRLFKKFQRIPDPSNRRTVGTGLGLYIVKGLVELQGGEMEVQSTYGRGSTFSFTIPVVAGETAE